jgi:NAD(P)-dependent dehydrogenase (short-subunit alcohol dehydrogenase family)
MDLELSGCTALVTGSSRGIGRAIAARLHAEGCRVALNARRSDALAAARVELAGSVGVPGDMSQPEDAARVVVESISALGKLDILVCNVGSGRSVPPGEETFAEWQRVFALNLWSTTNAVEAARDALEQSRGAIVCISSICGLEVIPGAPVTYSAAKSALHAYVRGIARPLGRRGVRINAVAPGNIVFDDSVWSRRLAADRAEVESMLDREVPLMKLGTPEDVASVVAYLASPRAAFSTGRVWTVDGGQTRA